MNPNLQCGDIIITNEEYNKTHRPCVGIITQCIGDTAFTENSSFSIKNIERLNHSIRCNHGTYEHYHGNHGWHRITITHTSIEYNPATATPETTIEINFDMVVEKGEPMYRLVSFSGIKKYNDLPTRYTENGDSIYVPILDPTCVYVGPMHFHIGDTLTHIEINELRPLVKSAAKRLYRTEYEIAELEQTHRGKYTITA